MIKSSLLYVYMIGLSCMHVTLFAEPWTVEAKLSAFIPFSHTVREIFHPAMPFLEVEASRNFCTCWNGWAGVGCLFSEGHSIGCCHDRTSVQVVPFTLGVRRFFNLSCNLDGFIGVGGMWSLYRNHDHSCYVKKHISANTFGGVVKLGVQYSLQSCLTCSLFTEYLYQKFSFHGSDEEHFTYRHDVDLSGIKLGLGIGYIF